MKKCIFILCIFWFFLSITPVTAQQSTTGGPVLEDIGRAQCRILYSDDNQIKMSLLKYGMFGQDDLHLITYNKGDRTINETTVDEEYECRVAYVIDGKFYALRDIFDKKNKVVRIEQALIPDKESVSKRDKLAFSTFLTVPNANAPNVYSNFIFSKNFSKFAVITEFLDKQDKNGEVNLAVYSMDGTLLWQQRSQYDYAPFSQFYLSDAGMITYLTFLSEKEGGSSITLQSWTETQNDKYKKEMPDKLLYSMNFLQLRNGHIMIASYYKEKNNNEFGLCTLLLDGEEELSEEFIPADELTSTKFNDYEDPIMRKNYFIKIAADLLELQNGNIVLMSESVHFEDEGTDRNGLSLYFQYTKDIYYNLISPSGELLEGFVFPHATQYLSHTSSQSLTSDRIYFCVKDDMVYAMYGDNINNYNGKSKLWCIQPDNKTQNWAILLSSFTEQGEHIPTVVLTPEYKKESILFPRPQYTFVSNIISNDKSKIYYILSDKENLTIEEIDY